MKLSNLELDNYSDGIDVYHLAENTLYKLETEKNESEKLIDMYGVANYLNNHEYTKKLR